MMFRYGKSSASKLATVKPDLQKLAVRTLELSPIDITITCGARDADEQKRLMEIGVSQTLESKHLSCADDGLARAFDFAPYINGKANYQWPFFYPVINAMLLASKELAIPFSWGGAWNIDMWSIKHAQNAQEAYIAKRTSEAVAKGQEPTFFFDGPHIEAVDL